MTSSELSESNAERRVVHAWVRIPGGEDCAWQVKGPYVGCTGAIACDKCAVE